MSTKISIPDGARSFSGDGVSPEIEAFVAVYTPRQSSRLDTLSRAIKFQIAQTFVKEGKMSEIKNLNQKVEIEISYEGEIFIQDNKGWVIYRPEISLSWKGGETLVREKYEPELFALVASALRIKPQIVVELPFPIYTTREKRWYPNDWGGDEVEIEVLYFKK